MRRQYHLYWRSIGDVLGPGGLIRTGKFLQIWTSIAQLGGGSTAGYSSTYVNQHGEAYTGSFNYGEWKMEHVRNSSYQEFFAKHKSSVILLFVAECFGHLSDL
jgi:hypothetical protein